MRNGSLVSILMLLLGRSLLLLVTGGGFTHTEELTHCGGASFSSAVAVTTGGASIFLIKSVSKLSIFFFVS